MRAFFGTHSQRATSVPTSRHTRCALEAERCRREDGRATHPHHWGGWRGGIACRNPVVKSTHEAKMRWGETVWSSFVKITKYLTAVKQLREKNAPWSCDFRGNPTGDEYQRCQGVSRTAGDTSTIWGESWCAVCGDEMTGLRADFKAWFFTHFYIDALPKRTSESRYRSVYDI